MQILYNKHSKISDNNDAAETQDSRLLLLLHLVIHIIGRLVNGNIRLHKVGVIMRLLETVIADSAAFKFLEQVRQKDENLLSTFRA